MNRREELLTEKINQIHNRPVGPLEEGDQALIDAVDMTANGEFKSPHRGIHKPFTVLSNSTDGSKRTVKSTHYKKRELIKRKRPYEGAEVNVSDNGIMVELRDMPDDAADAITNDMQVSAVNGNVARHGNTRIRDRELAQSMKLEAARRIQTAHMHLGEVGIKSTS